jgi:hypothetical protein
VVERVSWEDMKVIDMLGIKVTVPSTYYSRGDVCTLP